MTFNDKTIINNNKVITLTEEQQSCVNHPTGKNLSINGAAGSGKSLIIMKRAMKYVAEAKNNNFNGNNHVAVFTYNKTLQSNLAELLKINEQDSEKIKVSTLDSYIGKVYSNIPGHPKAKAFDYSDQTKKNRLMFMEKTLQECEKKYGHHRLFTLPPEFWVDELKWMREMNISLDDFDVYKDIKRTGRGKRPQILLSERDTAFHIYKQYNQILKEKHVCEWEDILLYVSHHVDLIPESLKFTHVLIDEAQDQSLVKMKTLIALKKNSDDSDIVIALDMNQRIYKHYWNYGMLGIPINYKKLSIPFRCTYEIDALAESLKEFNVSSLVEEDKTPHVSPSIHGDKPVINSFTNSSLEKEYIIMLIKRWLSDDPNITIGLFGRTNSQLINWGKLLTTAGLPNQTAGKDENENLKEFSANTPGIKLVTIHSAKGMEFTNVIIPSFEEGNIPCLFEKEDEEKMEAEIVSCRNLAYVAMTRAMQKLVITYTSQKQSRFIDELNPEYYTRMKDSKIIESSSRKEIPQVVRRISRIGLETTPVPAENHIPDEINLSTSNGLKGFFESNGFVTVDKRDKNNGPLWVIGEQKTLLPFVEKAEEIFGASGSFGTGRAINHQSGWWTKSDK